MFRVYCSNIYGLRLLACFKNSSFRKLEIAYNNTFRILHQYSRFCSVSELFSNNSVMGFREIWRASQLVTLRSALESNNEIVVVAIKTIYTPLWTKL